MPHQPKTIDLRDHYGKYVRVFKNLHLDGCWYSIQHKGLVIGHVQHCSLREATFTVQPAGRAKVLRENKKQVHAFVNGILQAGDLFTVTAGRATYNPHKYASFVDARTEQPLASADSVSLSPTGVWLH